MCDTLAMFQTASTGYGQWHSGEGAHWYGFHVFRITDFPTTSVQSKSLAQCQARFCLCLFNTKEIRREGGVKSWEGMKRESKWSGVIQTRIVQKSLCIATARERNLHK